MVVTFVCPIVCVSCIIPCSSDDVPRFFLTHPTGMFFYVFFPTKNAITGRPPKNRPEKISQMSRVWVPFDRSLRENSENTSFPCDDIQRPTTLGSQETHSKKINCEICGRVSLAPVIELNISESLAFEKGQ